MNAQLSPDGGAILRRSVEAQGIGVMTGCRTIGVRHASDKADTSQSGDGPVTGVAIRDRDDVPCDMVVVAAGIRPEVTLAQLSGIDVERAILVDDQMRVLDDPDIYAVGECVQHRGEVYGLVAPLWEQAGVLAAHLTGADPAAAYHGTRTATKLKVAGVDVTSMGLIAPERDDDEIVVFSEPRRGIYKSVVVREDKVVGATLLGDTRKVAFLTQAFDQGLPLPQDRVELLFDIGGPDEALGVAELADDAQVCNCNGVSKGGLVACVRGGMRCVGAVMDATRAGKGCGSCKETVAQVIDWACGGAAEVDESTSWYVPGVPLAKPDLMARIREIELRSVSAVFAALAPAGAEDAKSKMRLASLLSMMWGADYIDERDARFVNDRVHANIQKDGTFSVVPQMKGGVTSPDQLRRIADVADKYQVPMVKCTGGQRIDLLGIRKEDLPGVWADLDMPSGYAYGKSFAPSRRASGASSAGSEPATPRPWASRSNRATRGSNRRPSSSSPSPAAPATAPSRCARTSGSSRSRAAAGRSTSAAPRAPTSARATCSPPSTPHRRCPCSRVASCSTTASRPTGSSAPTPSCRGWASSTCARSSSTTPSAWPPGSTSACRRASTPTSTRGPSANTPPAQASSARRCR